jgi:glutamate dehydrogenase (NAD(P)+)
VVEMFVEAAPGAGLDPATTRFAVQGFGNVGSWAARILQDLGATLVGASDSHSAIRSDAGIDAEKLQRHRQEGGAVGDYPGAEKIDFLELLEIDCDLLVPAALGGMIHRGNADRVGARMVVEGANSPTTPEADRILADHGVTVIPDVMANAGGVVVSYFEWVQNLQHLRWDEEEVNQRLGEIMRRAYGEVAGRAETQGTSMRLAAYQLGIERVVEASRTRGYIS